jgi:small subunit ribosomal protein S9
MTVGVGSLRCSIRAAFSDMLRLSRPQLRQTSRFSTASIARAEATELAAPTADADEPPPTWEQTRDKTRLVPASPSYFTGNPGFYDNWLALQELLRKFQTLPTVSMAEAPPAKWKTLAQYRGIVGASVKAARYKKICNVLDRLNCINPTLIPREVSNALDMYRRDLNQAESQAKPQVLDYLGRARAVGRRKTSVARVLLAEGTGEVLINGSPLAQAFERLHDRESAVFPLLATGRMDKYNVWATVMGGGKTGQAEALTLGVARALLVHEPALKPALRRGEFEALRSPYFYLRMVSNLLQLALSLVIPGWLNVRSPVTSRLARCLPGSSVKGGKKNYMYLYSGSVHNTNGYCLELIPLHLFWFETVPSL